MKIAPFSIEQFFAKYEFSTPHILCASDCETMTVAELLAMAGQDVADLGSLRLGYTESQGSLELRTAVAQQYDTIDPDHVIVLTTPEEGIYITMQALLDEGDHAIVLSPAYDSLLNMPLHVSHHVDQWWVKQTDAGWQVDVNELESLVTPQTKLIVVNFPHNPTGFLPSQEQFEAIIEIARRNGAWLFCDEMYRGLELNPADRLPSAADLYERSIVLAGLSKVQGLPGLRSGWLVVQDEPLREELINWKHYTSICPPTLSEALALTALSVNEQLAERNRAIIADNLQVAESFFARWEDLFGWQRPLAGSVALVGINVSSATEYCHQLAQEAGVLLLPSSCLGYGDNHIRLGLGRKDFADNLAVYEAFLQKARGLSES